MKVIHIESGLGNQMLSYCEYLAMKKANPTDNIYIENIIYDIPECNDIICQWNGYELERVFGIKAPNIKECFTNKQWKQVISDIKHSEFWNKNWNYPIHFTKAFQDAGLEIKNIRGDFEEPAFYAKCRPNEKSLIYKLKHSLPALYLKMWKQRQPIAIVPNTNNTFLTSSENLFTGQQLWFKFKGSGIEYIEKDIRESFTFPTITDEKNREAMEYIQNHNAVAIHARRGDMLGYNYPCYVTGYFKRAIHYIKRHTSNPIFFIFCDPDSVAWAIKNQQILGLDSKKDEIHFVDWNKDGTSFRDMQLMAACKHQVITNSSFGWWGAWLNIYPNKITCSPDFKINTTHTF